MMSGIVASANDMSIADLNWSFPCRLRGLLVLCLSGCCDSRLSSWASTAVQMVEKYLWALHDCKPGPPTDQEGRLEKQRLVSYLPPSQLCCR